mmetsp:Transcript_94325/g.305175  ORF Transcript_94325/g.305175 Transcript_94325/m.305175 type:complete len:889 (-) Transcript_94325:94-2760(-)
MARFPTTAVGGQCDANSSRLLRRVRYYTPLPFAREGARRLRAQRSSEASLGCGGALMEVASQAAPTAAPTASSSFSSPAEGPIALQPRSPRSPLPLVPPVQELPVAVPRPTKTTVEIKTLVPRLLSTPSTTARREPTSQSYRCKAMMEVVDFQMLCEHTLERLPSPHIKDAKVYEVDSGALMHADGCGFGLTVAWHRSEDGGQLDLASKLGVSVFRMDGCPGTHCTVEGRITLVNHRSPGGSITNGNGRSNAWKWTHHEEFSGWWFSVKLADVFNPALGWLHNGRLHVMCELSVKVERPTRPLHLPGVGHLEGRFSDNLVDVLLAGEHTDVTIEASDMELGAHFAVLAARSTALRKMLTVHMRERFTMRIPMRDLSGAAVAHLLYFIYKGDLDVEQLQDDDLATDLLRVADMYDLPLLVERCLQALTRSLSVENAADRLQLALDFGSLSIQAELLAFIDAHPAARRTPSWECFARTPAHDALLEVTDRAGRRVRRLPAPPEELDLAAVVKEVMRPVLLPGPLARLKLSRSAQPMLTGKCTSSADVTTAALARLYRDVAHRIANEDARNERLPGVAFTISGCGDVRVNGTYTRQHDFNGKPSYALDDPSHRVEVFWGRNDWRICCNRVVLYASTFDCAAVPAHGWRGEAGATPTPAFHGMRAEFRLEGCGEWRANGHWIGIGSRNSLPQYCNVHDETVTAYFDKEQHEWRIQRLLPRANDAEGLSLQESHILPSDGWQPRSAVAPVPDPGALRPAFRMTGCGEAGANGPFYQANNMQGRAAYRGPTDSKVIYWNRTSREWRLFIEHGHPLGNETLFCSNSQDWLVPVEGWQVVSGTGPPPTLRVAAVVVAAEAAEDAEGGRAEEAEVGRDDARDGEVVAEGRRVRRRLE